MKKRWKILHRKSQIFKKIYEKPIKIQTDKKKLSKMFEIFSNLKYTLQLITKF